MMGRPSPFLLSVLLSLILLESTLAFYSVTPYSYKANHRSDSSLLKAEINKEILQQELSQAETALQFLDTVESDLRDESLSQEDLDRASVEIDSIESEINSQCSEKLVPPKGLSTKDYISAILAYAKLPVSIQLGLYYALQDLNVTIATVKPYPTVDDYPELVAELYQRRYQMTPQRVQDSVQRAQNRLRVRKVFDKSLTPEDEAQQIVDQLLEGKAVETVQNENTIKQLLGRVTRKEDATVTEKELDYLYDDVLKKNKSLFVVQGKPEPIPGGYTISGILPKKTSPKEMIEGIDALLPPDFNSQVSYLPDLSLNDGGEEGFDPPKLVVLNKDFSPAGTDLWATAATVFALFTSFYYGTQVLVDADQSGDIVAKLQGLSDEFAKTNWIQGNLVQILAPLALIQGLGTLGSFAVAKSNNIKTSLPTLLPFAPDTLPNLGLRTNLLSSPPNLSALFDYAFVGSFISMATSVIILATGLQLTLTADPAARALFPVLTVGQLSQSSLASAIVDYLYGGAAGVISSQDAATVLSLHPYTIAGFAGLMISALELMPLGSNQGGRMALSLFNRSGFLIIGGAMWFTLFAFSTFLLEQEDKFLFGAWAVYNVVQNDMEVPCRDEVTNVDVYRGLAGLTLWFVAALTLIPMTV